MVDISVTVISSVKKLYVGVGDSCSSYAEPVKRYTSSCTGAGREYEELPCCI